MVRNDASAGNTTGFLASGWWRIRPIEGKVKCGDSVSGNPNVLYDSDVEAGDLIASTGTQYDWYAFEVVQQAPSSYMLLQDPGGPTPQDVVEWVNLPYEVNADGETNSADLAEIVEAASGS